MDKILIEISGKEENISKLLEEISALMKKEINHKEIYVKHLKEREKFLKWMIKKSKLQFEGMPKRVYKRDIFYCELGYNLGSEQTEKRPVVILQNNRGNSSSPTTIVAPITTHKDAEIITEDNGDNYFKFIDDKGNEKKKKLNYYEVPVELEPNYKQEIKGYINVAQIRTISKKRLSKGYVANITHENDELIKEAVKKLLEN